jgi:hypothetical protein
VDEAFVIRRGSVSGMGTLWLALWAEQIGTLQSQWTSLSLRPARETADSERKGIGHGVAS